MANELVTDVASATPLATILTRKLLARDLRKRSRGCSPVLAPPPSRSMPGLNHGVAGLLREQPAHPQPVARVRLNWLPAAEAARSFPHDFKPLAHFGGDGAQPGRGGERGGSA